MVFNWYPVQVFHNRRNVDNIILLITRQGWGKGGHTEANV